LDRVHQKQANANKWRKFFGGYPMILSISTNEIFLLGGEFLGKILGKTIHKNLPCAIVRTHVRNSGVLCMSDHDLSYVHA